MKSIITNDIITKVSNDSKLQSNTLSPYKFSYGDTIGIGAISIVIQGENYHLRLPDDAGKTYLKSWKEDVGALLTKDLRKKDTSRFYEFKASGYRALLRKIDDSEKEEFEKLGFCHVLIGDYYYTIIKVINNNESYGKVNTLIDEDLQEKHEDDSNEEVEEISVDEISEIESLSLFD